MGLEWVLAIWAIAQLLILGGLGLYAHNKALAVKDGEIDSARIERLLDVTETELEVARAQIGVLRKAASNATVDLEDVRSRVHAERERRMLLAAREDHRDAGDHEATEANDPGEDPDSGVSDLDAHLG